MYDNNLTKDEKYEVIIFLELPKFRKKKDKDYRENDIERWLMFLEKDISETTLKELISLDAVIGKAEKKIEYLSSDEETMRIYYERERSLHERANMISTAEARGKHDKAIEIAKNLLDVLDNETIAIKTGLDIKEIKDLRDKNC
ncbi:PD-(D/E)XK nuclease family transposase [uncultured Clostridium sp.]|uniref:PD-(D/E)XK nuclease family transposase n=1 Tax=uncultured Clostridium sp. TaxID=59620 RepID=UPI00280B03F9|nr:PD-(D/E)XK nuclease family transposase [uncultured Clostridium sp.]MDU4884928.1 PD-(D/E)XK nuclease family transposase [Clostridium celatum]